MLRASLLRECLHLGLGEFSEVSGVNAPTAISGGVLSAWLTIEMHIINSGSESEIGVGRNRLFHGRELGDLSAELIVVWYGASNGLLLR